ncbi:MAG: FAD-dependent oxidoreductase [Pseudomonadota bacterium]
MAGTITTDLCILGAGSGGLSVAAGAVQMGATVTLIEGGKMGGDCLNYGCVPSKALIAAGKKAHAHRHSGPFGVAEHEPEIDYAAAMGHVQHAIDAIAPHDSVERFEGLGVRVIQAWGKFVGPTEVEAGEHRVKARRVIISTGSSPFVPPIPGLSDTPHLTNETLWENRIRPDKLLVIGGGPIGLEMAQAHRRLGSEVVVLEAARALAKDDPEVAEVALARLRGEGIEIREGTKVVEVGGQTGTITATLEGGEQVAGTHLLVAVGRKANVDGLDLEKASIAYTAKGVTVDKGLRSTTNRKVYAIGDVAGGLQFTHVAGWHAGLVVRNALFRLPVSAANTKHVPWATYTDPEIAHVGLTEVQARQQFGDKIEVHRFKFADNDRGQAERETDGLIKMVACSRGQIHGVSIVGPSAGDLIGLWALAISKRLKVAAVAGFVAPYPTYGEVSKRVAGAYFAPRLFQSSLVKKVIRFLARLG